MSCRGKHTDWSQTVNNQILCPGTALIDEANYARSSPRKYNFVTANPSVVRSTTAHIATWRTVHEYKRVIHSLQVNETY